MPSGRWTAAGQVPQMEAVAGERALRTAGVEARAPAVGNLGLLSAVGRSEGEGVVVVVLPLGVAQRWTRRG